MQFKVPQNIDLEDKIVGPLTLIQFLYILGGALIDYILFQTVAKASFAVFIVLASPISLVALALAFLKIQDQPLSHFIKAGLIYLQSPQTRLWQRRGHDVSILTETPKPKETETPMVAKNLEKSQLEQLARMLDTRQMPSAQEKKLGSVSQAFEKLLKEQPKFNQGGKVGAVGQAQTTNR